MPKKKTKRDVTCSNHHPALGIVDGDDDDDKQKIH